MKKRKGITQKEYQANHLSQMKKKVTEEIGRNSKTKRLSPIIQALADSDRFNNGSPE